MASINLLPFEASKFIRVAALPNAFNSFFSHFKRPDSVSHAHQLMEFLALKNDITITNEYVTTVFKKTKIMKAAGPDRICGRTLHYCFDQLGGIFSTSFSCVLTADYPPCGRNLLSFPFQSPKTRQN